LGIVGDLQRFRAEHYRFKWIAEFINCDGNALPSSLLPINYPCGLVIVDDLQRFRAEHYRFKWILKFINYGGNALPLQNFVVLKLPKIYLNLQIRRGRAFAPIFINYHRNLDTQMLYPLRFYQ
jgi:hypothetical protein